MSEHEFGVDIAERQQAEQAQRRMDELFRALIENALDVITIIDAEGVIRYQSPSVERVLGYKPTELIGVSIVELLHPDDVSKVNAAIKAVAPPNGTPGIAQVVEARLRHKDGSWRILESIGKELPGIPSVTGIVLNSRDITERKRAEETLRKSEERLRLITDSMLDMVSQTDIEGVFQYVNPSHKSVLGYRPEAMLGKSMYDFIHPADIRRVRIAVLQALKSASVGKMEVRYRHADGHYLWLETSGNLLLNDQGAMIGAVFSTRDITERKRAEEALRESQQLLEKTFTSLRDAVFILDADTTEILDCNPVASEIFGYSRQEMLGRTTAFLHVDEVTLAEFRKHLSPAVAEKGFLFLPEFRMKGKDGMVFPTEHSVVPLADAQGKRIGWVSVVRDITERKQAEEALQHSKREWESTFDAMSDWVSLVDLKGRVLRTNRVGEEVVGVALADMVGQTICKVVHDSEEPIPGCPLQKVLHTHQREFAELQVPGEDRWWMVTVDPVMDDDGNLVRAVHIVRDITERKRAEEQYRIIVRTALDGFWIVDMQGRFLDVNDAYCNLIGYSREELLTMSIPDVEAVEKPEETAARIRKIMEVGGDRFETRHRCKDGRIVDLEVGVNYMRDEERMFVFLRDITARKRAEEALRESEEKLKEAQALGRIGNWEFDLANQSIKWSDEVYRLYERDPAMGPPSAEEEAAYYSPEQAKRLHEYARCAIEQGQTFEYDLEARLPSGRIAHFTAKMRPVQDETGRVVRLFGTVQDITERKRAEGQIRRRNEELAALNRIGQAFSRLAPPSEIVELLYTNIGQVLDNRNLYIALYDEASQSISFPVYTINGERRTPASRPFGNGLTEYVIRTKAPLLIPRNQPAFLTEHGVDFLGTPSKCFLAVPMRVGERVTGVIAIQDYERENVYDASHMELLDTLASQATIALENARLYSAVQQELDERKRTEEALQVRSQIIDAAIDSVFIHDLDGNILYVNESAAKTRGYTRDEIIGMNLSQLDIPEFAPLSQPRIKDLLKTDQARFDSVHRCKDGSLMPIAIQAQLIKYQDRTAVLGIVRDITERQRAEEALRRRAEELAALQATVLDIISPHSLPELLRLIVERAAHLLHASSGGLYLTDPEHRQVRCVVSYNIRRDFTGTLLGYGVGAAGHVAQTGQPLIIDDYRHWPGRADVFEEEQPFQAVISAPLLWQGNVTGVLHVLCEDVSERFTQEDLGLLVQFANHAAVAVENARLHGALEQELTEHKRAEEALQESEQRYRSLFMDAQRQAQELALLNQVRTALARELDLSAVFRTVVEAIANTFGYTQVSLYLLQGDVLVLQHQVGYDHVIAQIPITQGIIGRVARTGEPVLLEDVRTDPTFLGAIEGIVSEVCVPLFDQGKVVGTLNVENTDGVKLTEAELRLTTALSEHVSIAIGKARLYAEVRESWERYRTLVETSPDAIVLVDLNINCLIVNQQGVALAGCKSAEEIINRSMLDFIAPQDRPFAEESVRKTLETGSLRNFECTVLKKDGTSFPVELSVSSITDAEGKPNGFIVMIRDITARKQAEEQLQASLREKELLLQEIHHRVKNNLQVVSSLLSLQAEQTKDRQTFEAFRDSQNRIRSMALIHEKLYQSPDLARVDFAEYLQSLAAALCRSYGADVRGIGLNIQTDKILLGIDTATPCGLLLNELISNALKHAFPAGRAGEIRIEFRVNGDKQCILRVSDNGVGFPQDLEFRTMESLGLQLVNTLVRQLAGSIKLERAGGTSFEITFTAS